MNKTNAKNTGFSLIELTIVLTIAGLLIAGAANLFHAYLMAEREDVQEDRISGIQSAFIEFFEQDPNPNDADPNDQQQRYPCPADPSIAPGNVGFGVEQRGPGDVGCAETGAITRVAGASSDVYIGSVPFASMGISSEMALDAFQNRLTYAITETLTLDDAMLQDPLPAGEIIVTQEDSGGTPFTTNQPFAVISHGVSGAGAFSAQGIASATTCGAGTRDDENCDNDLQFAAFSRSEGDNAEFFDDEIVFSLIGAASDVADQLWAVSPANSNDIFNRSGGSVGIGDDSPDNGFKLDIDGALLVDHHTIAMQNNAAPAGDQVWEMIVSTASGMFSLGYRNDDNPTVGITEFIPFSVEHGGPNHSIRIDDVGNVGIGTNGPLMKLDVEGSVKIGAAADADCVAATAGATRYNAADDIMEYCAADDGSGSPGWTAYGGGGGQINYDNCEFTNNLYTSAGFGAPPPPNATAGKLKDTYGSGGGGSSHAFCPDNFVMVGLKAYNNGPSASNSKVSQGLCCELSGAVAEGSSGGSTPPTHASCGTRPHGEVFVSSCGCDTTIFSVSSAPCTMQCNDGTNQVVSGPDCGPAVVICFTADTMVLMADGSEKAIQDIVVGDVVTGQDGTQNEVLELFQPVKQPGHLLFAINDDNHFVTADHPFMTLDGWKSMDPELTAISSPHLDVGQLSVGDTIITKDGTVEIASISEEAVTEATTTYNFRLSGNGTYYADGYLVSDYQGRSSYEEHAALSEQTK